MIPPLPPEALDRLQALLDESARCRELELAAIPSERLAAQIRSEGADYEFQLALQEAAPALLATARAYAAQGWQPIEVGMWPDTYVLVALIRDGVVHRVSEAKFNGLGWYDKGGNACHWRTHWAVIPEAPPKDGTR